MCTHMYENTRTADAERVFILLVGSSPKPFGTQIIFCGYALR